MFDDHTLARLVLQDAAGIDADEAKKLVASEPTILQSLRPQIEKKRAELQAELEEIAEAKLAASPEGRRKAAEAALEAQAARERLIAGAKLLLAEKHGDVSDDLTDEQILDLAGIEPSQERIARERDEELANDYAANAAVANDDLVSTGGNE